MPQLSFEEIKSLHEQAKSSGNFLGSKDLKGFASTMQQYDQDNDWSQGQLPDNVVTKLSRGIDKGFEATGLPQGAGKVTGSLGGLVDSIRDNGNDKKYETLGQKVGEGLPRAAAGVGLAALGTLAAPASGGTSLAAWAPAASLVGLGAADAGIKAYSDTGSKTAGLLSAATVGAAPGISSVGSKLGVAGLSKFAPSLVGSPVAKFVASEIGQEAAFFGVDGASTALQEGDWKAPFTPENLFSNAVGTVAFAPTMIPEGIKAARTPRSLSADGKAPTLIDVTKKAPDSNTTSSSLVESPPLGSEPKRLFDFVTGQNDVDLKKAVAAGNLKGALELTGLVDPDISQALETTSRRQEGRQTVSTLAEKNDPNHWEANNQLFQKAATLLQTSEVDVRNLVQMVAANNAFARKFGSSTEPVTPSQLPKEVLDLNNYGPGVKESFDGLPKPNFFPDGSEMAFPPSRLDNENLLEVTPKGVLPRPAGDRLLPGYGETKPDNTKPRVRGREGEKSWTRAQRPPQWSKIDNGPAGMLETEIFRFVKGKVEFDGSRFTALGNTQVPANGLVNENRLLASTQMPKDVFELVKKVYPEAWEGSNVNVNKLRELEKTRPMFETHVYGQDGNTSAQKARFDRLNGELDIAGYHIDPANGRLMSRDGSVVPIGNAPQELRAKIEEVYKLAEQMHRGVDAGPRATSYYDSVLQSAAEKMTRSKGESVDMGVPKNAIKTDGARAPREDEFPDPVTGLYQINEISRGSPVFRNADGTPKATATGRIYNIGGDIPRNVRYSKKPNPLLDPRGEITSETFQAAYERNLDLEGDPDRAMARTDAQVRGALMSRMKDTRPDIFVQDGLDIASRAFDEMGLDPGLKDTHLQATHKVLKMMDVFQGTRIKTLDDLVQNGLIPREEADSAYGVYLDGLHHLGIDPKNHQATIELGAFHFVKTVGHEALHALTAKADSDAALGIDNWRIPIVKALREFADTTDISIREGLMTNLQEVIVPPNQRGADRTLNDRLASTARYAASTSDEWITEYGALLATAMASPRPKPALIEHLRWAPQVIQDFANGLYRTMSEITSMALESARFLGLGRGQVQGLNRFHKNMEALLSPDPEVVKAKQVVNSAMQPFRVLNGELDIRDVKWSKVDSSAVEAAVAKVRKTNWVENHILNLQQTANSQRIRELIPNSPRVMALLTTLGAKITTRNQALRSEFMVTADGGLLHELATMSDKLLSPEQILKKSNVVRVDSSVELRVKMSELYLKMNDLQESTNDPISFDHPEFQKMVKDLSVEDQTAMRAVFDAQMKNNENARDHLRADKIQSMIHVARNTYREAGLDDSQANRMGRLVMEMLISGKPLPAEFNDLVGTDKVVNFWTATKPVFEETMSKLEGFHASELRTGRWYMKYMQADGQEGSISVNTSAEKTKMERFLKKRGDKLISVEDRQSREFTDADFMSTRSLEALLQMDRSKYEAALETLDPASAARMREEFTIGEGIREELGKRKQFEALRKLKPGRELIDMYENQGAYIEVVAATLAKREARREADWEMGSKNWEADLLHKSEMQSHVHNILFTRNSSEASRAVMMGTTFVTMGVNVSGALTDAAQPLTMGWWHVARTLGPVAAAKAVFGGYSKLSGADDPTFKAILTRATNEQHFFMGNSIQEAVHINDSAGFNIARAGEGKTLIGLTEQLTKHQFVAGLVMSKIKDFAGVAHKAALIPMSLSSQLNMKIMLRAGMIEGQHLGLKDDQLYQHAINVMQVTNAGGGRAAHGAFKNDFGKMNNWVMVATQLTNYPLSMISSLYTNYRDTLKSSGLTAPQRKRAQQVFAGQLTMQFALSGSLGLGLGTLFKLTEQIFGFSPEEEVRKGLASLDESGTLADVLLSGVANKVTGLDFASRFSLGGVMGLNDYSGFDAKGLIGPSATLWGGLAKLPMDIKEGTVDKSMLLPNGIRKMIEATQSGPFKDRNGQALIDPTTTERIAKFIGFNSDRLAKVRKQRDLYKFADESKQRENQLKTNVRIELMNDGRFDEVLKQLNADLAPEVQQWRAEGIDSFTIQKMVEKETRSKALQLVTAAVQKSLPLDPLSQGNKATSTRRRQIAASFGNSLAPRSDGTQQQALSQHLLQGLDQAAIKRSPRWKRINDLAQELIVADPTFTPQEAQFMAEQELQTTG